MEVCLLYSKHLNSLSNSIKNIIQIKVLFSIVIYIIDKKLVDYINIDLVQI